MAQTTPVHTGYSIINGAGSGPNGGRIQVWAEYLVGQPDVAGNRTWLTAYFYAALDPNYTSSTSYYTGLNSTFTVDGVAANGVTGGAYDFTSADRVNLLGSFGGWVYHNADGSKDVPIEGQFTTVSSYISGGSVSGTVTLPAIARAAKPVAVDTQLGRSCRVSWTPALARHSFQLTFSLGSWKYTTDRITPGAARPYEYTGLILPLEVARQFAGASETMTVALTTYDGDILVGQATHSFTVIVPDNADTRPVVSAQLRPEGTAFPGSYVQKLSKVFAQTEAEDPLGAAITGYTISAGGSTVSGTLSDYLDKSDTVTVTVTAENSRGFTGVWQQQIRVIPYSPPRLLRAVAYRCLSDGTADPGGTYLCLEATSSHSAVESMNECGFRWRYRPVDGSWSDWESAPAMNDIETGPLADCCLEKDKAYTVQLEAVDTAGGAAQALFSIPVEQVYMHRTKDAMGLGGYVKDADTLDVHWHIRSRKSINGAYIRTVTLSGTQRLPIQSRFSALDGVGDRHQVIHLFGAAGGQLVRGFVTLSDNGAAQWEGSTGVTVTADRTTGVVTVTLPDSSNDRFALISPDPIG